MPSRASIRAVGLQDAELVAGIVIEMLADSPMAFGESLTEVQARSESEWQAVVRGMITPGLRTAFVAIDDLGGCGFLCADAAFEEAPSDMVVISRVWVAPRQRGSGLGKRLMQTASAWAQDRHAKALGLGVTEMNTNALQFYEHLGFRDMGVRYAWPPDPTRQIIVLGKELKS